MRVQERRKARLDLEEQAALAEHKDDWAKVGDAMRNTFELKDTGAGTLDDGDLDALVV